MTPYHGKILSLGFEDNETDPKLIGLGIINNRQRSVEASIATQSALSVGVDAVQDEEERLGELLGVLIKHKLLTEDDRPTWDKGDNRITMARKIYKYREILLDERILPFIEPGYSVLYQLVSLYEDLASAPANNKEMADA